MHRYGFVVEKLWHERGCTGLPVLSCERSRAEELTSPLSFSLSLFPPSSSSSSSSSSLLPQPYLTDNLSLLSLSLSSVFPRHHHRRTQSYPNNFVQHKATLDRISGRSPSKLKNYADAYATRFFGEDARQ